MRAFCSVFSQILKLFPRSEFEELVRRHKAERHARGFSSWGQLIAMLFCQLGRAQSLREICDGLASAEGKLNHLGISAPCRSTLAYANAHRSWQLFESLFHALLARCHQVAPGHGFRFKNRLLSIDSTVIDLCAELFDWAKFKRTKGAVKLHMLLDHDGLLPSFAVVTEGRTADIQVARDMEFPAGAILVFDRGYEDHRWFEALTSDGVYFVTRMKRTTRYDVVENRKTPQGRADVVSDQTIHLSSNPASSLLLRRVEVLDPDGGENLVFLSNHLELGPTTIALVYKQRWQVELLFKALKQNLRIRTFVGVSPNALKTQIWTALIAMLILRYLQLRARYPWSLSNLLALLRFNLFTHRELWAWLDDPFPPPSLTPSPQLALA